MWPNCRGCPAKLGGPGRSHDNRVCPLNVSDWNGALVYVMQVNASSFLLASVPQTYSRFGNSDFLKIISGETPIMKKNSRHDVKVKPILAGCCTMALALAGCNPPEVDPVAFEPNMVYAERLKLQQELVTDQGASLMKKPLDDAQQLLVEWFGTPDDPKIPKALQDAGYKDLFTLENLKMAAGPAPASKEPSDHGLYRQLCVTCHGETGNGRGTTAASQNPYPRDFRMGVFKFKSTPRNSKPARLDIVRDLKKGLAGSQMPVFDKLNDKQIHALTDYVVYLSIRGELERELLKEAAFNMELDSDPPERVYSPDGKAKNKLDEQLELANEKLTAIADAWLNANDQVQDFPPPTEFPVDGLTENPDAAKLTESIAKGKELFLGTVATCAKCHGESGKGDGKQPPDYDDWVKDMANAQWGVAPDDMDALRPLLAIGAMKPQPIPPRNLAEGKFRGGSDPIDIFRRIRFGIAGSPMPAAALSSAPGQPGLTNDDIWHIVNFVRSLSKLEPLANK